MAQPGELSQGVFLQLKKEITWEHLCMRSGTDTSSNPQPADLQIPLYPNAIDINFEWLDEEDLQRIKDKQPTECPQFQVVKDVGAITPIRDIMELGEISTKLNNVAELAYKCGFRYVKNLARGGYATTVLVEYDHQEGGWGPYVLKIGHYGPQRDLGVVKELACAKHIVQRVSALHLNKENGRTVVDGARPNNLLQQPLDEPEPCRQPYAKDLADFDDDPSLLLMEYCRHGDLAQAIGGTNVKAQNEKRAGSLVSEAILWRLFQCLNKSIIALAYPPMHQPQPESRYPFGAPVTEQVPPEGERTLMNFVHFDIDPSNIFIGEPDQYSHSEVPIFKLGDFGTAEKVDINFTTSAQKLWRARRYGKKGHKAPEQWSAHWDTVDDNPLPEGIDVAGHYGSATNVYQIAAVMFCAIMGRGVPHPPLAQMVSVNLEGGGKENRYTLGWELLEEGRAENLSDDLRDIIVDCLSLDPRHRLTLEQLDGYIAAGIESTQLTDEDRAIVKEFYLQGEVWQSSSTPWTPGNTIDPNKATEGEGFAPATP